MSAPAMQGGHKNQHLQLASCCVLGVSLCFTRSRERRAPAYHQANHLPPISRTVLHFRDHYLTHSHCIAFRIVTFRSKLQLIYYWIDYCQTYASLIAFSLLHLFHLLCILCLQFYITQIKYTNEFMSVSCAQCYKNMITIYLFLFTALQYPISMVADV